MTKMKDSVELISIAIQQMCQCGAREFSLFMLFPFHKLGFQANIGENVSAAVDVSNT